MSSGPDTKWTGRDRFGNSYGSYRDIVLNRIALKPGGQGYYEIGDGAGGHLGHYETEESARRAIDRMLTAALNQAGEEQP